MGYVENGETVDAKGMTLRIRNELKKAYTNKDRHFGGDGPGVPEKYLTKFLEQTSVIIYNLLVEYNNFIQIYTHSAKIQQGKQSIGKDYGAISAHSKARLKGIKVPTRVEEDDDEF